MNLFDYIHKYAESTPNHLAVTTGKEDISYKLLEHYINRAANYMISQKYEPGEVVLLKLTDKKNFILMFLGVLKAGCRVVPVPDDIKPQALTALSSHVKAKGIITDSTLYESIFYDTSISLQFDKEIPASEFYHITSGSTGGEKICIRTVEALTCEGETYRDALRYTAKDILLGLSPLYHSFALGAILAGALTSGACIYVMNKFVPQSAIEVICKEKITRLAAVPVMAKLLCISNSGYPTTVNSLRTVLVGGGTVTEEVFNQFQKKFGRCISPTYGSTETGGLLLCNQEKYKTSVGRPMPGVDIKIVDSEGKAVLEQYQGELWVRCQGLLKGYLNISANVFDSEGYYPMGDLAYANKEGYIFLAGRIKNIINIGGKKVNPLEIEAVIKKLKGVKDCVVLGLNQKEKEVIKAVIVPDGNIELENIRHHCLKELESYKLPSIIEIRSHLPRDQVGKIKKEELLEEKYGVIS